MVLAANIAGRRRGTVVVMVLLSYEAIVVTKLSNGLYMLD